MQNVYDTLLRRTADAQGLDTFVPLLAEGTITHVEAQVLGSPEYGQAHGGDDAFLEALNGFL